MKVMFIAPYIYDKNHPEFTRTSSGFGYMVNDILREISQIQETYLITHQFTDGYIDSYVACKHTKKDFIKNVRLKNLVMGVKHFFLADVPIELRLRYMYYYLNTGSIEACIKKVQPDIIHIHGLTYQTKPLIELCEIMKWKYIVTLHGLNGLDESVNLPNPEKEYEYFALKKLEENKRIITVVSSGIKNCITTKYKLSGKYIRVILNGTYMPEKKYKKTDPIKYQLICVGTVGKRKNQIQLIRACELLPENIKNKIEVQIIGVISENIDINEEIEKRKLSEIITYYGFVPREKMVELWNTADLNVVMSKSEGFGLSIIEGFSYGVPTITFYDIDALVDLYDEKAMQIVYSREDKIVAEGIVEALEKDWDSDYIMNMAKKYSMDMICNQYNKTYFDACRREL